MRKAVPEVSVFGTALAKSLNRRRRITIEVPEFVIRAIEWRVEEANEDDSAGDCVTFNDVVEWLLVTETSTRRMPLLEQQIPGFTAAMFTWMMNATYEAPDEE
jgi:hypothetical protein